MRWARKVLRLTGPAVRRVLLSLKTVVLGIGSHTGLLVLLGVNVLVFNQARKQAQRAHKLALWRSILDLDEDSLRRLVGSLPAWVKFEDYEPARFVNQAFRGLWPYLDKVICCALKEKVEPIIQGQLPFPISGFTFEKLSLGEQPFHLEGVKHTALFAGPSEEMRLSLDIEASWVVQPDIIAKLMPSSRWRWHAVDVRPAMYIKLEFLQCEGLVRLSFPLMTNVPIFSGMTISFMEPPQIDLSVKMLGGADLMSLPSISTWLNNVITTQISQAMTFPNRIDVPFISDQPLDHGQKATWPKGIAVVNVRLCHLPPRTLKRTAPMYPSLVLHPPAEMGALHGRDMHAMAGLLVERPERASAWAWRSSVPVFSATQVLKLYVIQKSATGADVPTCSTTLPLAPVFEASAGRARPATAHATLAPGRRAKSGGSAVTKHSMWRKTRVADAREVSRHSATFQRSGGSVPTVLSNAASLRPYQSDSNLANLDALADGAADLGCMQGADWALSHADTAASRPASPRHEEQSIDEVFESPTPSTQALNELSLQEAHSAELQGPGGGDGARSSPPEQGPEAEAPAAQPPWREAVSDDTHSHSGRAKAKRLFSHLFLPTHTHSHPQRTFSGDPSFSAVDPGPAEVPAPVQSYPGMEVSPDSSAHGPRPRSPFSSLRNKLHERPRLSLPDGQTAAQTSASAHDEGHKGMLSSDGAGVGDHLPLTPLHSPHVTINSPSRSALRNAARYKKQQEESELMEQREGPWATMDGPLPKSQALRNTITSTHTAVTQGLMDASNAGRSWRPHRGALLPAIGHSGALSHFFPGHARRSGESDAAATASGEPRLPSTLHDEAPLELPSRLLGPFDTPPPSSGAVGSGLPPLGRASSLSSRANRNSSDGGACVHVPWPPQHRPVADRADIPYRAAAPDALGGPRSRGERGQVSPSQPFAIVPGARERRRHTRSGGEADQAEGAAGDATAGVRDSNAGHRASDPALLARRIDSTSSVSEAQGDSGGQPSSAPREEVGAPAREPSLLTWQNLQGSNGTAWDGADSHAERLDEDMMDDLWGGAAAKWEARDIYVARRATRAMSDTLLDALPGTPSTSAGAATGTGGPGSSSSHREPVSALPAAPEAPAAAPPTRRPRTRSLARDWSSRSASPLPRPRNRRGGARTSSSCERAGGDHAGGGSAGSSAPVVASTASGCAEALWASDADATRASLRPGGAHLLMSTFRGTRALDTFLSDSDTMEGSLADFKQVMAAIFRERHDLAGAVSTAPPAAAVRSFHLSNSQAVAVPRNDETYFFRRLRHARQSIFDLGRSVLSLPLDGGQARGLRSQPSSHRTQLTQEDTTHAQEVVEQVVHASDVVVEERRWPQEPSHLRHYGGSLEAELQWMPLQWTYFGKGVPVPEPAVVPSRQLGGTHVHKGVLLVRLIMTTLFGIKLMRPMVTLKFHRGPQGQDVRRTGVRERWSSGNGKDTVVQGTVKWELLFSFSLDVDADPERRAKDSRCLEIQLWEVATTFRARVRAYWTSSPDMSEHAAESATKSEGVLGVASIPISKFTKYCNRPLESVFQLLGRPDPVSGGGRGNMSTDAIGQVVIETTWLPACAPVR